MITTIRKWRNDPLGHSTIVPAVALTVSPEGTTWGSPP